jgi:hypothetical protein
MPSAESAARHHCLITLRSLRCCFQLLFDARSLRSQLWIVLQT